MNEKIDAIVKEMADIIKLWKADLFRCKLTGNQITLLSNTHSGLLSILGRMHPTNNPNNDQDLGNYILIKRWEQASANVPNVVKLVKKKLPDVDQKQITRLETLYTKLAPIKDIKLSE